MQPYGWLHSVPWVCWCIYGTSMTNYSQLLPLYQLRVSLLYTIVMLPLTYLFSIIVVYIYNRLGLWIQVVTFIPTETCLQQVCPCKKLVAYIAYCVEHLGLFPSLSFIWKMKYKNIVCWLDCLEKEISRDIWAEILQRGVTLAREIRLLVGSSIITTK